MKTVEITADELIESVPKGWGSGQLEQVADDLSSLKKLVEALVRTLGTEQLMEVYINLHGSSEHPIFPDVQFGLEDSEDHSE